uniref:Uncharacterized protein n=1 Tax=Plectus sambesii TaxID=2011161 RepID=A0A914WWB2_9BILA
MPEENKFSAVDKVCPAQGAMLDELITRSFPPPASVRPSARRRRRRRRSIALFCGAVGRDQRWARGPSRGPRPTRVDGRFSGQQRPPREHDSHVARTNWR